RQCPLPPPPRPPAPAGQQTRSRLPPRRQSHPTDRRSTRRLTSAPRLLNSSCLRFSKLESKRSAAIHSARLTDFLGHTYMARLTEDDIVTFRGALLKSGKVTERTVANHLM